MWRRWGALRRLAPASTSPTHGIKNYSVSATQAIEDVSQTFEEALGEKPLLVRDYIKLALYHPKLGYFARRPDVVGVLPEPLRFSEFDGRRGYTKHLAELYKQNDASWFTPVELFQPWYAYAIGEYILQTMNPLFPLKIYEVGGGTGTCASNVLEYIKTKAPEVYDKMRYTSVEVSEGLAKKQLHRICEIEEHGEKFNVECRSASDKTGWGETKDFPCYIIMLEVDHSYQYDASPFFSPSLPPLFQVLDNTPHDLLYRENYSSPWMETYVHYDHNESKIVEGRRPVQDPLIARCLSIVEKESEDFVFLRKMIVKAKTAFSQVVPAPRMLWIPTGCLELLEALHYARPNMVLVASDFSSLPDVKLPGEGAPLVSSKNGGVTKDYSSYLEAKGNADIFFPTDFYQLQAIDNHCAFAESRGRVAPNKQGIYRGSAIMSSSGFMSRFAYVSKAVTKSGYNPLLEEYSNTKVYLSAPAFRG